MTKIVFIVISIFNLLSFSEVEAQFLPHNTADKCEVSEVVVAQGFTKPVLYLNSIKWLKSLPDADGKLSSVVRDSTSGKISGDFEMIVYAQSGILRKIAGSISYHFTVETKDEKYRYSFGEFVFHFYTQDRNYRFVKTGKTKPLEENHAAGWRKLWTDHRKSVSSRVNIQIDGLKIKLVERSKEINAKADEKKVEW